MRIIIISNRLPFTVEKKNGKLAISESTGGLVSGLSAYLDSLKHSKKLKRTEYLWLGWPGMCGKGKKVDELKDEFFSRYNAVPVFVPEKAMDKFYNGFCNKTIWPLFHYFPSYAVYDSTYWNSYKQVNEIFCECISKIIRPDDIIWIHDYHLMLLPNLLRKKFPDITAGFFLHIPFPSYEVFRLLPVKWRTEILEGLLGADFIGFHTYDYTQYFLSCVLRLLGLEHDMGQIIVNDRLVKAETIPMGIDFHRYHSAQKLPGTKNEKEKLQKSLADLKVVLSIDRLDYTKGILNRLESYELFLEKYPQWHKKVVFVLVVVPSRIAVEHYQKIKRQIDEIVGQINGRFGDVHWTPILYQYRYLPFEPLIAVYGISDAAIITPLRDGMNLVAKEYIAAQTDKKGVLIISETTGASKELGEALIVNPNDREEIADSLNQALELPVKEQIKRNNAMQKRLKLNNVVAWARLFITELILQKDEQKKLNVKFLSPSIKKKLISDFKSSAKKIIFLDYDGTLVPFVRNPQDAKPSKELITTLEGLAKIENTDVILTSGRDKETLSRWFGRYDISLVAEHGAWFRQTKKSWKMFRPLKNDWIGKIKPILDMYAQRLPGSYVEQKDFSIVWHYRPAEPGLAALRAKELIDDLVHFTANLDIQVLQGSKVVEVRCGGVSKGNSALTFLTRKKYDFVLAIGDDWTDEDLFKILPESAYSIKVGMTSSFAKYNLRNYIDVRGLIDELAKKPDCRR